MPVAAPSGYDPTSLSPFIGLAVRLGVGARAVTASRAVMILGNLIATQISRTANSITAITAAGTATPGTIYTPGTPDEARSLFGAGSECHLACLAAWNVAPNALLQVCPVAESAGTAATMLMLFANAATSAGSVSVTVAGQTVPPVSVASGDAAATIAANVAVAINGVANLPVTATVSVATVTLTAKHKGPRGNNLCVSVQFLPGSGTGTLATTAALNGGTASATFVSARLGAGTGTPGATADDVTAALATIATQDNLLVACAHVDATNVGLLATQLTTYAGINYRRRLQGVFALTNVTVAGAVGFVATVTSGAVTAASINNPRMQCVYQRDTVPSGNVESSTQTSVEIAAAAATARLYGDGTIKGELQYAAANLTGLQLSVKGPISLNQGAILLPTELETLLRGGVTPLVPSNLKPGTMAIYRSITTYCYDTNAALTRAVVDTSKVTVSDVVANRIQAAIQADFPSKNIAPEPTTPRAPPNENVIYVSMIRSTIIRELKSAEGDGIIVNVDANLPALAVDQYPGNPNLVTAAIPEAVIPHFIAFAGDLQQVG